VIKFKFLGVLFLLSILSESSAQSRSDDYYVYQNPVSNSADLAVSHDGKSLQLGDIEYPTINCSEKDFHCIRIQNNEFILIVPKKLGRFCKFNICAEITNVHQIIILGESYNIANVKVKSKKFTTNYYLAEGSGIIGFSSSTLNVSGTLLSVSKKGYLSDFNFEAITKN
jgi:hypothetical protein